MDRGGDYILVLFLSGNLIGSLLRYFSECQIGQPAIFLLITPLLMAIIHLHFTASRRAGRGNSRYRIIIRVFSPALFLLLGFCNMNRPSIEILPQYNGDLREKMGSVISGKIPSERESAVVTAFVTGEKSNIGPELKKSYKTSGTMHILALSGLHVAIIYRIIGIMLFFLNFNQTSRIAKSYIASAAILFYCYICGMGASLMRASIMIIVWKMSQIHHRRGGRWTSLLLSASIILLIRPDDLTDIGFQLSFAALFGIIAIYPAIKGAMERCFPEKKKRNLLVRALYRAFDLSALSISCQISTAPFLLFYFGTIARFFIIANIVAVPLVEVIIELLVLSVVTGGVPLIGEITTTLLNISINLLNIFILWMGN